MCNLNNFRLSGFVFWYNLSYFENLNLVNPHMTEMLCEELTLLLFDK